ncbi:hypothetical protein C485_09472 [Natrinema altunense JCM 12890]|uniref:Uncharacterized protein n=1 Tax=Natrinema altunense (strain JCM 12890 / CGMCC 1.3731 / AJ2) TaxID=1227494 RepID=L9ZKT6_NATA2|nr:hypothetical protein C485_09472 [Natrinema altunense JCM 12890]
MPIERGYSPESVGLSQPRIGVLEFIIPVDIGPQPDVVSPETRCG